MGLRPRRARDRRQRGSARGQMQKLSTGKFHFCTSLTSLDHLVGAGEQRRRHFEAERFCGCEINNEIELSWLLDWDVTRLRPAEKLCDKLGSAPEQVWPVYSIGHQTSRFDICSFIVKRRQSRNERQGVNANAIGQHERVASDVEGLRVALERLESGHNIFGAPDFECDEMEAKRAGGRLYLAHLQWGNGVATFAQEDEPAKTGDDLS